MYCCHCGKELDNIKGRFCPYCGGEINEQEKENLVIKATPLEDVIETETEEKPIIDVLVGPILNFICFIGFFCIFITMGLTIESFYRPELYPEFDHPREIGDLIDAIVKSLPGLIPFVIVLIKSFIKIKRPSLIALIMAPIKGFVSIIYLGCLLNTCICAIIPIIGFPFAIFFGWCSDLAGKFSSTWIDYSKHSRGRVKIFW